MGLYLERCVLGERIRAVINFTGESAKKAVGDDKMEGGNEGSAFVMRKRD
jgi:hypothetical protein